jgi:hypothetical protein
LVVAAAEQVVKALVETGLEVAQVGDILKIYLVYL